ncbi:MAG: hypothetical protein Fur006_63320 [Coleofasciculaceae cyanobacterium]
MADWALVIGINKYDRLRSLDYAERDADLMRDFFQQEARFEQIFYFSDTSPDFDAPDGSPQSTRPTYANLRSFLRDFFEEAYLQAGDNFWFFFSGHGIRHQDRDYLMPCDANPRDVEYTAISISYVTERLRRCGADNVVLLLDACRNEGEKAGLGIGGEKQQGVITICSCSPREKSYEIEQIGQGAFTYALLESLRIPGEGNCATVERLYQRLRYRVAEINRNYNKPEQTPYAIVEPASKYHLILLPRQATLQDIATLREDAQEAELEGELELAEQLWTRVLALSPADSKALRALRRIWERQNPPQSPLGKGGSKKSGSLLDKEESKQSDSSFSKEESNKSNSLPLPRGGLGRGSAHSPQPPPATIKPEVELLSERNVDYTRLRDLLADGKWKEADEETLAVMVKAAGQEKENWRLNAESIEKFPCTDLRTIDRLWVKYSDGRFGFSVQKRIWESVGGQPGESDYEIYQKFGDRVDWRVKNVDTPIPVYWNYSNFSFSLKTSGHLPWWWLGWWGSSGGQVVSSLASRLVKCNI